MPLIPEDPNVEDRFSKRREKYLERRKTEKLAASMRVTLADIKYALVTHNGSLAHAAKFLGVQRKALKRRVETAPSLRKLLEELKEEKLDMAEYKLYEQVQDGAMPAITFMLRTLGKERGYTEKNTLEHEMGEKLAQNSAALIEAMRSGVFGDVTSEDPKEIEVKEYKWDLAEEPQGITE